MGNIFNIVGCECSKSHERISSLHQVRVTDSTKSELVSSTIIPKELYKDNNQKSSFTNYIQRQFSKDSHYNVFEKYMQICILGKTHYSTVYKVKNRLNNQLRAMKEIPKENIENRSDTKNIIASISMLRGLYHPNLIQLYEFYEDEKNFYLIYELCDEIDLEEILKEKVLLSEFLVKFIMYKIFLAVNYLHKNKIIHGNIKITNIGIKYKDKNKDNKNNANNENGKNINENKKEDKKAILKGLIKEINDDINLQNELLEKKNYSLLTDKAKNFINNLLNFKFKLLDCWVQDVFIKNQSENDNSDIILNINYFSPELFDGYIVKERDEWACGILMFYLIKGYYPFDSDKKEGLVLNIIHDNGDISNEIKDLKVSKECKDLITRLLNRKPNNRIKVEEVLKHDFFKKGIRIKDLIDLTK